MAEPTLKNKFKKCCKGEGPRFLIYILIPQAKSGDILLTAALLKCIPM